MMKLTYDTDASAVTVFMWKIHDTIYNGQWNKCLNSSQRYHALALPIWVGARWGGACVKFFRAPSIDTTLKGDNSDTTVLFSPSPLLWSISHISTRCMVTMFCSNKTVVYRLYFESYVLSESETFYTVYKVGIQSKLQKNINLTHAYKRFLHFQFRVHTPIFTILWQCLWFRHQVRYYIETRVQPNVSFSCACFVSFEQ